MDVREEVAKHCTETDAWIIVDNNVYDVTGRLIKYYTFYFLSYLCSFVLDFTRLVYVDYVDSHPGGDAILKNVGGDSTKGVHGPQHPASMWDVLALYKIGELAS